MEKRTRIYIDSGAILGVKQSGVGHVLKSTLRELDQRLNKDTSLEVYLITPFHKTEIIESYKFKNIRIQKTLFTGKLNVLWSWSALPFPMSLWKKGVYIFPNYRNVSLFAGSKSVTYVHDICFAKHPEMIEEKNLKYSMKYVPKWLRRSDIIVTVSQTSAQEIIDFFPGVENKIRVILNGIETRELKNVTEDQKIQAKNKFKLPRDYFIFLSNLEPRKNVRRLLDAYLSLGKEFSNKHGLVLVGAEGWKSEDVQQSIATAQEDGFTIIRPVEYVNDIERNALLSNARALIMPSIHEGFSMPPLEAVAAGTPVIASDIPIHREIIKNVATYVDPFDATSIASALKHMTDEKHYKEKKQQVIKDGDALLENYQWQKAVSKLVDIVEGT